MVQDPNSNGFPPSPEIRDYMPTSTVRNLKKVVLDGVPLLLIHTASAHTDGDLAIYLPLQRIVFAGDLVTPAVGRYPGIHLDKHGSLLGWCEFMKAILALDVDTYVSGHGDLLSKDELTKRLHASEARRAEIKTLFDHGKTLKEAKAALHDKPLKGMARMFPTFTETTYQELAAQRSAVGSNTK